METVDQQETRVIRLVGPGGAGKSTVGAALAVALQVSFLDLDRTFESKFGDIDAFIVTHGYDAYAQHNFTAYRTIHESAASVVIALSSGFMTYPASSNRDYQGICDAIARDPATFVLIPSLDVEICVAETVRRQLARPIAQRGAAREEVVIRERYPIYAGLPSIKVETMRPLDTLVAEILAHLRLVRYSECPRADSSGRPSV